MSPFDKRVNAYQKGAYNRSGSRGPINGSGPKPPKLQTQNSANSWMGRKPSGSAASGNSSLVSPHRGGQQERDNEDWHADLRMVKNKL